MSSLIFLIAHSRRRKGVALLFTLVAIVLLTVIILAFFSRAQLNRQISFTSTNQVRADLLSRSALNILVGELREEMRAGSTSMNGGNSAYPMVLQPNTTADVIPKRVGVDSGSPLGVVKVSANNVGIYSGGRTLGSSYPVSDRSLNGRSISATTWFGAQGPNLGSQSTLPTWVFVTRGNGIKTPTIDNAKDPTSQDSVIGRFAYTVYDIGSLLNANVAGSSATANSPFKGSLAYADLTQIPGITQSNVNTFVGWRDAADSGAAYDSYVQTYGESLGFLSTHVGDNAFFSRHDLLNFASNGIGGLTTAELPYLTHFSRSLNAPNWGPLADASQIGGSGAAYAYHTNANTNGKVNRFLPNVRFTAAGTVTHYNDQGTATTYNVSAGDPLVQRRFSLAKLAWITSNGVPPAGVTAAAIQSCFGLQWDTTTTPTYSASNNQVIASGYGWKYVGPTGSAVQSAIETLDQVGNDTANGDTTPREPNFFELLQAGILSGVTGVGNGGYNGFGTTVSIPYVVQSSSFLHILTIGANLIDQCTTDSYPTVLEGSWSGATDMVTGTKGLPMIQNWMDMAGASGPNIQGYVTVSLWNPYVAASTPTAVPPNIRVHLGGSTGADNYGFYDMWGISGETSQSSTSVGGLAPVDGWAQIPSSNFGLFSTMAPVTSNVVGSVSNFATVPTVTIPTASGTKSLEGLTLPILDIIASQKAKFLATTYYAPPANTTTDPEGWATYKPIYGSNAPFAMLTEFQSSFGAWIPYSFMTGINDSATWVAKCDHTLQDTYVNPQATSLTPPGWTNQASNASPYNYKLDPRSSRFSEMLFGGGAAALYPYAAYLPLWDVAFGGQHQYIPQIFNPPNQMFGAYTSNVGTWSPGEVAFNNGKSSASVSQNPYQDLDGLKRLSDYGLSTTTDDWANSPFGPQGGTPSVSAHPPVILNRPFLSVGEMGYTFADLPWRSLNFSDQKNAFGGLLDIFSPTDEPAVVDDRVNLNAPQSLVMQSLLSQAAQKYDGTNPLANPTKIASDYNTAYFNSDGTLKNSSTSLTSSLTTSTLPTTLPLSAAQLPEFLSSLGATGDGLTAVKNEREAVVRALAGTTQARTWNVLIDVVAQVGRYVPSSSTLDNFLVEGEKRYWLSVAIDRYTGKVIAQNLEPANE